MEAAVDALCGRRCAFAWYALPGGFPVFCMQEDGGMSPWQGRPGFLVTPWCGEARCMEAQLSAPPPAAEFPPLPQAPPQEPATTREAYAGMFRTYTSWLKGGASLGKVVLARTHDAPPPPGFSPAAAFLRACRLYPRAFNALVHTPQHGTWLCSTPEVLLQGDAASLHTMALAGTRPVGTPGPWDAKNTAEHALVVEHISAALAAVSCPASTEPAETLPAGQVEHLCTRFSFPWPEGGLPSLLRTLAPTPAVAGFPVAGACRLMASQPDVDRALYAGFMGPCAADAVDLYVTLRCMRLFPSVCRLYAGGGLLAESQEESEWRETLAKLRTMLNVMAGLANGNPYSPSLLRK